MLTLTTQKGLMRYCLTSQNKTINHITTYLTLFKFLVVITSKIKKKNILFEKIFKKWNIKKKNLKKFLKIKNKEKFKFFRYMKLYYQGWHFRRARKTSLFVYKKILKVINIKNKTPIPQNGCRMPKKRRI